MPDSSQQDRQRVRQLTQVLKRNLDVLTAAKADPEIVRDYASLLKFLTSAPLEQLSRIFERAAAPSGYRGRKGPEQFAIDDSKILSIPNDNLEHLILDEKTPRLLLERIAVLRFKVPRGSLRSFSNRGMLVDKLITLIRNEETHATIARVARGRHEGRFD